MVGLMRAKIWRQRGFTFALLDSLAQEASVAVSSARVWGKKPRPACASVQIHFEVQPEMCWDNLLPLFYCGKQNSSGK